MVWWVLYALAIATLFLHWGRRNAVWGAATIGAIIGIAIATFGEAFDGWIIANSAAIAALIGAAIEHLPRLFSTAKKPPDDSSSTH